MRNLWRMTEGRVAGTRIVFAVVVVLGVTAAVRLAAVPADEYSSRQKALDMELAAEHYALGTWCDEQKLRSEAREHFESALALDPGHKEAALKLGEVTDVVRHAKDLTCEFRLVNGDLMKAELLLATLKVQTPSGFLLIPVAEADLIELGVGPLPDRLISDAYVGEGRLKVETFSAKSKVGPINVKRQDIKTIRILRPCEACVGKATRTCLRCAGKGRLSEKNVCPTCKGKGKVKCETCEGKGKITCPLCGGIGRFRGAWGRLRRVNCPRCDGTGKVDCPDCDGKGGVVCPTCNGNPITTQAGPCPVCNGAKVVPCEACGGTGVKPLPKIEVEGEHPGKTPPDAAEGGQP
ncbi:MAG TPA: hypothetical protein VMZ92_03460 [Planctomycetota bacterium]|nr:hypothetical protein [Planctomycetota bacterium]